MALNAKRTGFATSIPPENDRLPRLLVCSETATKLRVLSFQTNR